MRKRDILLFLIPLIILSAGFGAVLRLWKECNTVSVANIDVSPVGATSTINITASTSSLGTFEHEPVQLRLMFVGDIMLDRGVRKKIETVGDGDFRFPFSKINGLISSADLTFGNLEGPISNKGEEIGNLYSFRMLPQSIDGLLYAGFDALSLANNHIGDWGRTAIIDTITNLREFDIIPVGAGLDIDDTYAPRIVELKGTKIALLAFSDFRQLEPSDTEGGVAITNEVQMETSLNKARQIADVVVVMFHFGDEYIKDPTERQRTLAQFVVDRGADIVIGSHSHVLQPLETYNGKYIAYGLGNFIFDQNFSFNTMTGGLLSVVLIDTVITSVTLHTVRINDDFQAYIE